MRTAVCHPERKHYARGFCNSCYNTNWLSLNIEARRLYRKTFRARDTAQQRVWRSTHTSSTLKYKYGISVEIRDAALAAQDNRCAICRGEGRLVIDHDHTTMRFRGMLCVNCNVMIGLAHERPELFAAAAAYLKENVAIAGLTNWDRGVPRAPCS